MLALPGLSMTSAAQQPASDQPVMTLKIQAREVVLR